MITKISCFILFVWVWAVSMLDHYWTIKLADTIQEEEKNPIGLWLLELDGGNPALFMTVKMICLWLIFVICLKLYIWRPLSCLISLSILALAQLLLVLYFLFGPFYFSLPQF
jgi:hypothetical protein